MTDIKEIIADIASLEYDLFVVNTHAVAVQGADGKYYTKYFPVSPLILQGMMTNQGSLGCYQQVYKSNYIRWLCLDFDCKKDAVIDLEGLYKECIVPVTDYLDECGVHYLLEFSGRRGIHIWIIFDKLIKKSFGFQIVNEIFRATPTVQAVLEEGAFGLDKFPATGIDKRIRVGKQVKFPLSWHKKGSRSYFFLKSTSDLPELYSTEDNLETEMFYKEQLDILQSYKTETRESIVEKLGIEPDPQNADIYTRYKLIGDCTASVVELVEVLSETKVYQNIFRRMQRGQALPQDWLVLLGTFSPFASCEGYLTTLFSAYPNYDVEKTLKNVRKFRDKYYPATFDYLYRLYDLSIEPNLNPIMTGVDYIAEKYSFNLAIRDITGNFNENSGFAQSGNIVAKELDYLKENDEVISVSISNKLSNIREVEIAQLEQYAEQIIKGRRTFRQEPSYTVYERHEEDGRVRLLVSLSAFDRLITTDLVLHLCGEMKHSWKSYSYRISYLETNKLFFSWFSSWSQYIDEIRAYLELPFMDNNYVIYLDIKHCYDNIDLLVIYSSFKESLSDDARRAFQYLCAYNDSLMKGLNSGQRTGVPQGPAYARILTEIYLDDVIDNILAENNLQEHFRLFRYVDDIVVFCDNADKAKTLYDALRKGLGERGLPINTVKSRNYGRIGDLEQKDIDELLHRNRFNYDLVEKSSSEIIFDTEKKMRLMRYLRYNPFEISIMGYIFSGYTFSEAKDYCYETYGVDIMSSREGRGKYFRQFYRYLLSDSDKIQKAVLKGWFEGIPLDSINFSNFITTLYFMIQESAISEQDVRLIVLFYLGDGLDLSLLSTDDRAVVEAIQLKYR